MVVPPHCKSHACFFLFFFVFVFLHTCGSRIPCQEHQDLDAKKDITSSGWVCKGNRKPGWEGEMGYWVCIISTQAFMNGPEVRVESYSSLNHRNFRLLAEILMVPGVGKCPGRKGRGIKGVLRCMCVPFTENHHWARLYHVYVASNPPQSSPWSTNRKSQEVQSKVFICLAGTGRRF